MIAMMLFVVFLVAGIFGITRMRKEFLGDDSPSAGEENPAWLEAAIAEHRSANAKSQAS